VEHSTIDRAPSHYNPLESFKLPRGADKHYQQQYADMYFVRLAQLKPVIEQQAAEEWDGYEVNSYPLRTGKSGRPC
jgi:DNA polymerase delta subunit 2